MKFRALLLIAFAAAVTLSFSFAANENSPKTKSIEVSQQDNAQPFEGFISEDKF